METIEETEAERKEHEIQSEIYDDLIQIARDLPGQLLEKANVPIAGISSTGRSNFENKK